MTTKTKQAQLDKLIRAAATQEVDGPAFCARMEEWLDIKDLAVTADGQWLETW